MADDREAEVERAARDLARTTPYSVDEARAMLARLAPLQLSADELGTVARFGIHDPEADPASEWEPEHAEPASMTVAAFMAEHDLTRVDVGEVLREYRSETGWSAFELGARDVLDSEFLNWHRWERLA